MYLQFVQLIINVVHISDIVLYVMEAVSVRNIKQYKYILLLFLLSIFKLNVSKF